MELLVYLKAYYLLSFRSLHLSFCLQGSRNLGFHHHNTTDLPTCVKQAAAMAESIALAAFLRFLVGTTVSLTPFLVGQYKTHLGVDVNKEAAKLRSTLEIIQAVIEDAEKKQHNDKAVGLWLAKLKDAAYDVDDILDEFQWEVLRKEAEAEDSMKRKVRHFFSSENPILFHIKMGRRIKEFVEKLDLIAAERSRFDLSRSTGSASNYQIGSNNRTETHSFVIESEVVGRREDKNNIVESW